MKKPASILVTLCLLGVAFGYSQSNRVLDIFPEGTVLHGNINYANDTLQKHLLDIYLPPAREGKVPLVIWVHGGGWLTNDKYADMSYMKQTIHDMVSNGYALASIDYRFSTQAVFPAQIRDCNQAVSYLYDHAGDYGFDTDRMAVMGFSAGGHLASFMGLSRNDAVPEFFVPGSSTDFGFKAVVDFYGPAELILFPGADDAESPEGLLLGAAPLDRPDLSRRASPVTYVDAQDPPFLIIHGEKDDMVSPRHSKLLGAWLNSVGVENEVIIVEGAPHFGVEFDADHVRRRVLEFLKRHLE